MLPLAGGLLRSTVNSPPIRSIEKEHCRELRLESARIHSCPSTVHRPPKSTKTAKRRESTRRMRRDPGWALKRGLRALLRWEHLFAERPEIRQRSSVFRDRHHWNFYFFVLFCVEPSALIIIPMEITII